MVREALQVGEIDKGTEDVFHNLDEVLNDDFRHPIPIGIPSIDKLLQGGLAKGEIGVILAPTGVGKSTLLTKIANHAFSLGYNVLQIFFEDNPKIIQRKHFTLWTGISPDELANKKEEVMKSLTQIPDLYMIIELIGDSSQFMVICFELAPDSKILPVHCAVQPIGQRQRRGRGTGYQLR